MTKTKAKGSRPTRSRGPKSKGKIGWWARIFLLTIMALVLTPVLGFVAAYLLIDVPEPEELPAPQVSFIYAADGTTELARVVPPEGNRRHIPYEQIPEAMKEAVIAAEDREFWSNNGFSLTGFARAALGQITGNASAGGGSTITQQYVKNALVGNEHSYQRKAKELVYSVKMAADWEKEEVMEAYLNTVYFGRQAYGVDAASRAFFGKPADQLTTAEAAVLAASIQRPSQLDPWLNRAEAESRWNYVLDGMVETGAITPRERREMKFPETIDPANTEAYTQAEGTNGHIKNQIMDELKALGFTEADVTNRGLRVTSTIDMQAQNAAVTSAQNALMGQMESMRTAVVSVEPETGAVRAYYGGDDAIGWDFANAGLQTGSTFKIFGLAAGLQQGIGLNTPYSSAPVQSGSVWVGNTDGATCGTCSIGEALRQSLNTSFIRLQRSLRNGTQDTADMAHALGVARSIPGIERTLSEPNSAPYDGIILGQYQTRPIDMSVGLATLANHGMWNPTHFVERVVDRTGDTLYEYKNDRTERRVSAYVADNVMQAMLPIAQYSNGNVLAGGRESAAKSGTAQLGTTGLNKDVWFIGTTPQLATSVWVGTVDNSPLVDAYGSSIYGANLPATIWKNTMDGAHVGKEFRSFPNPGGIPWATTGKGQFYGNYGAPTNNSTPTSSATSTAPTTSSSAAPTTAPGASTGAPEPAPAAPAVPLPLPTFQDFTPPIAPAPVPQTGGGATGGVPGGGAGGGAGVGTGGAAVGGGGGGAAGGGGGGAIPLEPFIPQ